MPKTTKTIIYKIIGKDETSRMVYIGSTTSYLCTRKALHVHHYKLWKHGKTGKLTCYDIFDKYGIKNCKFKIIETHEDAEKKDINDIVRQYIENTPNIVNTRIPGRSRSEYYHSNVNGVKERDIARKKNRYKKDKIWRVMLRDRAKGVYYSKHGSKMIETLKEMIQGLGIKIRILEARKKSDRRHGLIKRYERFIKEKLEKIKIIKQLRNKYENTLPDHIRMLIWENRVMKWKFINSF